MAKKVTIDDLARITANGFSEVKTEFFEIKKTLKEHGETLKDHTKRFADIDQRFADVEQRLDEIDYRLEEIDHRLEKVELNTRVYPYDKEYVDKKFANHESRISRLELKKI